jgi:predicted ATPase/Tfp pilus assembly protein PilF
LSACPDCIARLAQAAELYRGELLAGFSLPGSLAFDDWLLLGRERFRLEAIDTLGFLAQAYAQQGDEQAALLTARRQLALDPWNEQATRTLMQVLAGRGQRAAALAEYERCRRLMAEELNLAPSPETQALAEGIRQQAEPLPPAAPVARAPGTGSQPGSLPRLPQALSPLVGRQADLERLRSMLTRPDVRLLTLLGPPGIGKTRLALALADYWSEEAHHQAAYLDLTAVGRPDTLLELLAQELGASEGAPASAVERLARSLRDRPILVVLDNFEHLLLAAPQVANLLGACPLLRLLVTSRAPLGLAGEQRYPLAPLALPDLEDLPPLAELAASPAVTLFVACAQAVDPCFNLTAANAAAVAGICTRLDGLPLAIELAAAGIRLLPPARLLERLSRAASPGQAASGGSALRLLRGRIRQGSPHTLRHAFQWSYAQLEASQQLLFARLAVFAGSFDLEAAEAVCHLGDLPSDLLDDLSALLDNSLLQRVGSDQDDYRFSLLETLREFALERLEGRGETALLRQRHADYYLSFAAMIEPRLSGLEQAYWLERAAAEQRNLRQALEWCQKHAPGQFLALALALFPFWHTRAHLSEGRAWLEAALAANSDPSPARARALAAAALLAQRQGDFQPAHKLAQDGVELARWLGEGRGLAYALNNLGIVRLSTGDNPEARALAEESLAICEQEGYPLGVARAQMILGQAALTEGRLEDARYALEASLTYWRASGDQKNAVLCVINLGRAHLAQGNDADAHTLFEHAAAAAAAIKDRQFEAIALWNLGDAALRQGQHDAATPRFQHSLRLARRLGDRYFEALSLNRLGAVALQRSDFPAAQRLLDEGLALSRRLGDAWCEADALYQVGLLALAQSDLTQARSMLAGSARLFEQQGERAMLDRVREALERVEQRGG